MRYRDIRQTVIRDIATPDPDNPATPRFLSAYRNGRRLRAGVLDIEVFTPVPNRAAKRRGLKRVRTFRRGVALLPVQKPWNPEPFKTTSK